MTDVRRYAHGSRVPGWDRAVDLDKPPCEVPEPATTPVPEELRRTIEAEMAKYPDRRSAVMGALHAAQHMHGWCSREAIDQVACVMQVTPAFVESIVSFYDMYEVEPKPPKSVYVCTNISCSLCGADDVMAALQEVAGEELNVRSFECLGACDIAPMASVDGVYVGPLEPGDASRIVEDVRAGRPVLEHKQIIRRPSTDDDSVAHVPHGPRQEASDDKDADSNG